MEQDSNRESTSQDAPLFPIRKVVLSKNGIGYFERSDKVAGNTTFNLYFKASDMNDVLKSLSMVDLTGGVVSSISYESTKPFSKQLEDISISLNENSTLKDLLGQVKGALVEVETATEAGSSKTRKLQGVVIGLETVQEDSTEPPRHFLNLLVNDTFIQFIDLEHLLNLRFVSEMYRRELQHLLEIMLQSKKKDLKGVTAYTKGKGERTIVKPASGFRFTHLLVKRLPKINPCSKDSP